MTYEPELADREAQLAEEHYRSLRGFPLRAQLGALDKSIAALEIVTGQSPAQPETPYWEIIHVRAFQ